MQHRARKRFGQNFLVDTGVIQRIATAIGLTENDVVLEIGPGRGALTEYLVHACKELIAIELDRDLASRIPLMFPTAALKIIQQDALEVAFDQLSKQPMRLVGNLPYNISTPLLFHFLRYKQTWQDAHIMVQKEVADRMVATSTDNNHGRLSVMLQVQCRLEKLFDINPNAFQPAPKVTSSVVRLVPLDNPLVEISQLNEFSQLVKTGFSHRRKTLHNNFKNTLNPAQFEQANIDPRLRAQALTLKDWVALYQVSRV